MDPNIETGTKYQFLKVLGDGMKDLALHLFDMQWTYSQIHQGFRNIRIWSFGPGHGFWENYLNQIQDEPQSLFWYHTQTVHY